MKKKTAWLVSILLVLSVLLSGCSDTQAPSNSSSVTSTETIVESYEAETPASEESPSQPADSEAPPQAEPQKYEEPVISLTDLPAYSGDAYIPVNGNVPFFTADEYTTKSFEQYSSLDSLGRCGVAFANIGLDLMPTEDRGDISSVKPSGWINKNYGDLVDGGYLYNRCHLIGFQLSAENANERNLITGTRYLNIEGMLPFENMTADYVHETGNHVLYRVTPIYDGNNLVASGVLMEGYSVEDSGADICFCVYCYNVQPGIVIDYATGESYAEAGTGLQTVTRPDSSTTGSSKNADYILNTNTHKFHYPECSSVDSMKESNKEYFTGSRDEVIARGYDACGRCKP